MCTFAEIRSFGTSQSKIDAGNLSDIDVPKFTSSRPSQGSTKLLARMAFRCRLGWFVGTALACGFLICCFPSGYTDSTDVKTKCGVDLKNMKPRKGGNRRAVEVHQQRNQIPS